MEKYISCFNFKHIFQLKFQALSKAMMKKTVSKLIIWVIFGRYVSVKCTSNTLFSHWCNCNIQILSNQISAFIYLAIYISCFQYLVVKFKDMQPRINIRNKQKIRVAKRAFDCVVYYSEKSRFLKPEINKMPIKLPFISCEPVVYCSLFILV